MDFSTKTAFRTHTCNELSVKNINEKVTLCGFVHRIRDHGGLLFIDLRDHYGITQCVLQQGDDATINPNMATGEIGLYVDEFSNSACNLDSMIELTYLTKTYNIAI